MDSGGVSVSTQLELSAPNPLELDLDINDNDVEAIVMGGTPPYTYSIDGGQTFSSDRFFTDLELGDYEFLVEDANGCTITQTFTIISTSVGQIDPDLIFSLTPNPAQGSTTLTLNSNVPRDIQLSLVDIIGRTVRVFDTSLGNGTQHNLDINGLVPGTYLVRVDSEGYTAVKKLIIQ